MPAGLHIVDIGVGHFPCVPNHLHHTVLEPNGALAELFDLIGRMRNEDERRARVDHFLHFALAFLLEQKVPDRKDFVYNEDVRHNHRRN